MDREFGNQEYDRNKKEEAAKKRVLESLQGLKENGHAGAALTERAEGHFDNEFKFQIETGDTVWRFDHPPTLVVIRNKEIVCAKKIGDFTTLHLDVPEEGEDTRATSAGKEIIDMKTGDLHDLAERINLLANPG